MKNTQDRMLEFLYKTIPGRQILKILVCPAVSRFAGRILDSGISTCLIRPFIKSAGIDMSEYEKQTYHSFNEFFTRKIKKSKRPVEMSGDYLISPCDGAALVLPMDENCVFHIKKSEYTAARLLRSRRLAEKYKGGTAVVLRLAVHDYHRYCYVDDGIITQYRTIPGIFHTVQPLANDYYPVYHENTREYCTLHSENFKDIIVMEVGALLVGRIVNDKSRGMVKRGEEKGRFEYGGSTIVLLFEKDTVNWKEELIRNSSMGQETPVKMGEILGKK